jgi:hypothetical protein
MVNKIMSSDLIVYLSLGMAFLGTFITIEGLIFKDWETVSMYSTLAALSFINVLWIDKERKRHGID